MATICRCRRSLEMQEPKLEYHVSTSRSLPLVEKPASSTKFTLAPCRIPTGNGTGDLRGIIQRLDYFQERWGYRPSGSRPYLPRRWLDFGYDIADYTDIDPLFGSMTDFDELLEQTHQKGMKLILDLVPNHSVPISTLGFRNRALRATIRSATGTFGKTPSYDEDVNPSESRINGRPTTGRASSAARPGSGTKPREQYYYHAFLKEQPDLNWRNPAVQKAMLAK